MKTLTVYIGYDPREDDAYQVCKSSLERHSSIPLNIVKLELGACQAAGLYHRPFRKNGVQMVDLMDGRPFSTEFSFTRFLVPALSLYQGWACFVDCDFLFTDDIAKLVPLLDQTKAVMVVKHDHIPSEKTKMDGVVQTTYPRKNWSSFILWNCGHPDNRILTSDAFNRLPGSALHGFVHLTDEQIGEIPITWNWLSGVNDQLDEVPAAIHFTLGVPSMKGHEHSPYADLWRAELTRSATEGKSR